MKIERISDTQVKFSLTHEDLDERNIKLSELAFGSEKAQAFFREITQQAADTCGFSADKEGDTIPLMVEAMPMNDGIVIIVSKVDNPEDLQAQLENRLGKTGKIADFGLGPASITERRFKKKAPKTETYTVPNDEENISIYKFASLEIASKAMKILQKAFCSFSDSRLYSCTDEYYLFVSPTDITNMEKNVFDGIINEFGKKYRSNPVTRAHIAENGELIIKNNAVNVLAQL
jgi:adapter protein MecA 1/2